MVCCARLAILAWHELCRFEGLECREFIEIIGVGTVTDLGMDRRAGLAWLQGQPRGSDVASRNWKLRFLSHASDFRGVLLVGSL
jgi:hypothetical protein